MALSEIQKQLWLSDDRLRIVIMEMHYHNGASEQVLRVASYPYIMPVGDSTIDPIDGVSILKDLVYDDIINNIPNIVSRIDSNEAIGGIEILNTDGEYDYLLNDVSIVGHNVRLYIGENTWLRNNFILILDGIVSAVTSSSPTNIVFELRDRKEGLNIPLQGQVITQSYWTNLMNAVDTAHTAGGFQGTIFNSADGNYDRTKAVLPEATEDTHVPICLGKCFNIEPVLVDSFNHIYLIHDSEEGIEEVIEVRSNGIPLLGPNPRYMPVTTASASFQVGDIITDNNNIKINGRVFKIEGTAPNQNIFYYPEDDAFPFSATTGTFTANIDSNPELNPDPLIVDETVYDLSLGPSCLWSAGNLNINKTTAPTEYISINYQDLDTINGQNYVLKVKVENFIDGGVGASIKVSAGYNGQLSGSITADGEYQSVLQADNTGRPPGTDALHIRIDRGTVSLNADITLWSVREYPNPATTATAVDPVNGGTIIHRLDVGTYGGTGRWAEGFIIGERIVDNIVTPTKGGFVTNTTGTNPDNNYTIYYTPDQSLSDFVGGEDIEGEISGATSANIPAPVIENDGSTGQYEVDNTLGVIRLLDHSQGTQITCDVVGQPTRSAKIPVNAEPIIIHSAAHLIEWILLEKAKIPFSNICQETFPYTGSKAFDNVAALGIFYKEEAVINDVINLIANSVGGYLRFKNESCKLQLYKFIDPVGETPDLYIIDDDVIENGITINAIEEPKLALTLGFRKNWKTQDEGSLAGAITDASSPFYNVEVLNSFMNEYSTLYQNSGLEVFYTYKTNLLENYQDLTTWSVFGSPIVTLSVINSPNGRSVCYDIEDNDTLSKEHIYKEIPITYTLGDIYTTSVLIKKNALVTGPSLGLTFKNSTTDPYCYIHFDMDTGEHLFVSNDGTNCTIVDHYVEDLVDWWRVKISGYTTESNVTSVQCHIFPEGGIDSDIGEITVFEPYLNSGLDLNYTLQYPLAEDAPIIETVIFNEADAIQELARRVDLRNQKRILLRVQSLATSFTYDVGDIVNITHSRFGLANGKNALIVGMEESPTSNRVILDLWL